MLAHTLAPRLHPTRTRWPSGQAAREEKPFPQLLLPPSEQPLCLLAPRSRLLGCLPVASQLE